MTDAMAMAMGLLIGRTLVSKDAKLSFCYLTIKKLPHYTHWAFSAATVAAPVQFLAGNCRGNHIGNTMKAITIVGVRTI